MDKLKPGITRVGKRCADCGVAIGGDNGPPDGWQLEDGRTVCRACCVADIRAALNNWRLK